MVFNPGPNTVIHDNDTLIAMGKAKDLEVFEKEAGSVRRDRDATPWRL